MPNEDGAPQQNTAAPKDHKRLLILLGVLLVVVIIFAAWHLFKPKDSEPLTGTATPTQSSETTKINSDADLEKLENELKDLDIDGLNTDLEGNDKDSADF